MTENFEMGLTHSEVLSSIDFLTEAHKSLDGIRKRMNDNLYEFWYLADLARDAWNACNMARLYTEKISHIEERLVPIMGLVFDGREMFWSLDGYGNGMTLPAERTIVSTLRYAQVGIGEIVSELHSWLSTDCECIKDELDEETRLFIEGVLGG